MSRLSRPMYIGASVVGVTPSSVVCMSAGLNSLVHFEWSVSIVFCFDRGGKELLRITSKLDEGMETSLSLWPAFSSYFAMPSTSTPPRLLSSLRIGGRGRSEKWVGLGPFSKYGCLSASTAVILRDGSKQSNRCSKSTASISQRNVWRREAAEGGAIGLKTTWLAVGRDFIPGHCSSVGVPRASKIKESCCKSFFPGSQGRLSINSAKTQPTPQISTAEL
mmetsp:Transcript_3740/g.9434  ORF Transcript_3740/g.9434 Transcript_3740/m.9434 type:complete len:220 (-) Transcript_3740:529-1188(-)